MELKGLLLCLQDPANSEAMCNFS